MNLRKKKTLSSVYDSVNTMVGNKILHAPLNIKGQQRDIFFKPRKI